MKRIKKILSVCLCVLMLFSACVLSTSAVNGEGESATLDTSVFESNYPYVFVHGMGGWGEEDFFYSESPYWGGGLTEHTGTDLISMLREQGIEAYAPSVGPLSSAWDRACELYAQLVGTVVDYGEAHSKAHNHERYGFNYSESCIMGESWNLTDKINLVGHSFGGATVRLFTSLLAYGCEEEVAATGNETSELFTGGHHSIHSCITLSAPHNGSQVANVIYDTPGMLPAIVTAVNFMGAIDGNYFLVFNMQLSQFGLTPIPSERQIPALHWGDPGYKNTKAKFSVKNIINFCKSHDNCGYDMTLRGAAELNEKIKLVPETYYYSYSTVASQTGIFGRQQAIDSLNSIFDISSTMISLSEGTVIDGVKIEGNWAVNDGIVPLASSLYPLSDEATALDYEESETIESGRWYYLDTMYGMDHFDFCGVEDYPTSFEEFYFGMIEMANSRR